jgi:hypothetical protein
VDESAHVRATPPSLAVVLGSATADAATAGR